MFFFRTGDAMLLPNLMNWVNQRFFRTMELATQVLHRENEDGFEEEDEDSPVEDHPRYWEAVYTAVLHLQCDVARDLLRAHTNSDQPAFVSSVDFMDRAHKLVVSMEENNGFISEI
jgi:hypothetical protein